MWKGLKVGSGKMERRVCWACRMWKGLKGAEDTEDDGRIE